MAGLELSAFVSAYAQREWRPGETDCLLAIADWVVACGYADPAADLRGSYASKAEYERIIEKAGGPVPLIDARGGSIGLERAVEKRHGAIAVIGSRTDVLRQWGAIWEDGAGWRVRFVNGYPVVMARPLAIWRVL